MSNGFRVLLSTLTVALLLLSASPLCAATTAEDGLAPDSDKKQEKKERKQEKKAEKQRINMEKREALQGSGMTKATWRIQMDNDVAFGSDNEFTNGWSIQKHGVIADNWKDARGTWAFGKPLAKLFLPENKEGFYFREGFGIGQVMQTPDDLSATEFLPNDFPYMGVLYSEHSWIVFNDDKFYGFQWMLGTMGDSSLADETQIKVHDLIGSEDPKGWDNQLEDEPVLQFNWMYKKKLWHAGRREGFAFEGAVNLDAVVGNLVTAGDVALEMRFGKNMPGGFHYVPDPGGRFMAYDATLPPARTGTDVASMFYASLVVRAEVIGYTARYEGNVFNDHGPDVDIPTEDFVDSFVFGLHYQRRKWGIHYNWWTGGDRVDTDEIMLNPETDAKTEFATFMLEVRF